MKKSVWQDSQRDFNVSVQFDSYLYVMSNLPPLYGPACYVLLHVGKDGLRGSNKRMPRCEHTSGLTHWAVGAMEVMPEKHYIGCRANFVADGPAGLSVTEEGMMSSLD